MGSIAQMKGEVEPRSGVQGSRPPLTACHPSSIVEVDSVSESGRNLAEHLGLTVTAQYRGRRRRLVWFLQKCEAIAAAYQPTAGWMSPRRLPRVSWTMSLKTEGGIMPTKPDVSGHRPPSLLRMQSL